MTESAVFDCNRDDMIPMTGQILVTAFGDGMFQLAWRASEWHTWSPPIFPILVQRSTPDGHVTISPERVGD